MKLPLHKTHPQQHVAYQKYASELFALVLCGFSTGDPQLPPTGLSQHIGILSTYKQSSREASPVFHTGSAFQIASLSYRKCFSDRQLPRFYYTAFTTQKSLLHQKSYNDRLVSADLEDCRVHFEKRAKHEDSAHVTIPASVAKMTIASKAEGSSAVVLEEKQSSQTGQFETDFSFPV